MAALPSISQDGVLIIYFRDVRLTEGSRIENLAVELTQTLDRSTEKKMLLNFRNVKFMGSAMIGKLILFSKQCKSEKVELRVCELNDNLKEVFDMMKLSKKVFRLHPSEDEALKSFRKR